MQSGVTDPGIRRNLAEYLFEFPKQKRKSQMGKFVIRETATGVKFDLKAGNGEVIVTSEVYTIKAACLKGINSVKKNAPEAEIVE